MKNQGICSILSIPQCFFSSPCPTKRWTILRVFKMLKNDLDSNRRGIVCANVRRRNPPPLPCLIILPQAKRLTHVHIPININRICCRRHSLQKGTSGALWVGSGSCENSPTTWLEPIKKTSCRWRREKRGSWGVVIHGDASGLSSFQAESLGSGRTWQG